MRFTPGITVRFAPVSLCDLLRNHCAIYPGIGVRFAPELLCDLKRIVQTFALLDGGFKKRTHELTHEKVTNNLFMGYIVLAH